jgi:hypothetical protein
LSFNSPVFYLRLAALYVMGVISFAIDGLPAGRELNIYPA